VVPWSIARIIDNDAIADWRTAQLQDEAIALRPWEDEDLVDAFRTEELGRYFGRAIGDEPPVDDPDMPMLAIVSRDSQSVVGRVWCRHGSRPPEIGYFLREDEWGHGYATRALLLTTDWLLEAGGYAAVVLCTHPENERSQKVAIRCGFVDDGVMDEYALFKDGTRKALRFVKSATRLQELSLD
jgi:RimJ/RimL family protein N-acetyltransferase